MSRQRADAQRAWPRRRPGLVTVKDDVGHAYAAFSADAGRTFGAPIRLDAVSALGRVDVALLPDGSTLATWIEFAEQKSSFSMRRVEPSGGQAILKAAVAKVALTAASLR